MKIKPTLLTLLLLLHTGISSADFAPIKDFMPGSYQQILSANAGNGFMLVLWSVDCTSCIKDMELLSSIHKSRPDLKIVMISTDEPGVTNEVQTLLQKYRLAEVENWLFADDNSQKLRYEIDPAWYSELPRTYFFSASHQREGVSGTLKAEEYKARFEKLKI